ncbi:MAG: oligoendopeptidase F [Anaerovoracaceae bacterium]|jgi:oligoendopeptidase F|nr:oligoendopeptidase F [Anaerovoracaceae bacterium]
MTIQKPNNLPKIEEKYTWDLQAMYPEESQWKMDFDHSLVLAKEVAELEGSLTKSAQNLYTALEKKDGLWQLAEKVFVYSRMRKDEDNRVSKYIEMAGQSNILLSEISKLLAFFTPELLVADKDLVFAYLAEAPELEIYRHYLEEVFRVKDHVLSQEEERILAATGQVLHAPIEIFTAFNNADMKFGNITNDQGQEEELTHGNYSKFLESTNQSTRKTAFEAMYVPYKNNTNTLATAYDFSVRTNGVSAELRKYGGAKLSALSGDNIQESVYDNLVTQVRESLPSLHKYMTIRKRALKLDELNMYDLYVPIVHQEEKTYTFEEAVDLMCRALEPLGKEYVLAAREGVKNRWIDVYESQGKTSGAYSFGCYDSLPYILLNFDGKLKDVFTLVHEMGHSMHSYYTRRSQPYIYGGHSIFTAEVASTVNEVLLMHYLIESAESSEEKAYLNNLYLEGFRSTLFRQTMFAEFEDLTHKASKEGTILTSDWLCENYGALNKAYQGDQVVQNPQIAYEWSRIPHFYRAFYVYKYATGYSAANAIAKGLLEGGKEKQENYLAFLASGESDYPIELLKIAGVSMDTPGPVQEAMQTFAALVDSMDKLI